MWGLHAVLLLSLTGWVGAASFSGVVTTETFNQSATLDNEGNYLLFWNFNEHNVTFEVHVRTKGWVGFGISGNGKMFPADVVVGWVKDDTPHFADRHTVGHSAPVLDKSQDWHLLLALENDFGTVLKFTRAIDTCDDVEDKKIQEGTVRLIYAYGTVDPNSDANLAYMYHGGDHRGTKSVSLLSESVIPPNFPADVKYYEFLNENFLLPPVKTFYQCRGFQMPDLGGKHHMLSYEAVITPGNELHVHHIVLYRCKGINPKADGAALACYDHRDLNVLPYCWDAVVAWAIGGEPFYFPEHVGLPVGGLDDPSFYIMETHYDNPTLRSGVIDNSGIRVALTQTLRQHDLGLLQLGVQVDSRQMIPPRNPAFVSKGYCSKDCIAKGLSQKNLTEIKAVACFQHAHLMGVGIKTRHFRNGVELPPLMYDPNYDFDFQETRLLMHERVIRPEDSFTVECTYNSMRRPGPSFGGLSTENEMCINFMYYYPRIAVGNCQSTKNVWDGFGITEHQFPALVAALDWSNDTAVTAFMTRLDTSIDNHQCRGSELMPPDGYQNFYEKEPTHPYTSPNTMCSGN